MTLTTSRDQPARGTERERGGRRGQCQDPEGGKNGGQEVGEQHVVGAGDNYC